MVSSNSSTSIPASASTSTSSPSANKISSSDSPSRPSRFRRLASLRSRSHGADTPPENRDSARNLIVRPTLSRTASASHAINPLSSRRGGASIVHEFREPDDTWLSTSQPTASLLSPLAIDARSMLNGEDLCGQDDMTRRRSATTSTIPILLTPPTSSSQIQTAGALDVQSESTEPPSRRPIAAPSAPSQQLPSLRLVPFQDSRSSRPSLSFPIISRTLPGPNAVVRIGRYSEKDSPLEAGGDSPSDAPVGFKSKVVSRKHCELSYQGSSWWIKDVKSSSGTFLNHIRLSEPGKESKPYKVKDGDIVQLGIDFKGGEESIFRCVKMRILCNRGWQKNLNNFNTSAHKQLQRLKSQGTSPASRDSATDCTICLMAIGPCQSLFIAPCSHTWHYKCIRPIISQHGSFSYPQFLCPNCRAVTDLEEDIEETESWEAQPEAIPIETEELEEIHVAPVPESAPSPTPDIRDLISEDHNHSNLQHTSPNDDHDHEQDTAEVSTTPLNEPTTNSNNGNLLNNAHHIHVPIPATRTSDFFPPGWNYTTRNPTNPSTNPLIHAHNQENTNNENNPIINPTSQHTTTPKQQPPTQSSSSPSTTAMTKGFANFRVGSPVGGGLTLDAEGPMTPRNEAGPFVFDGAASPV